MSADNKHINCNADDIQRYLQGKMTPLEMHALEKAALDDEFLADAIEGYSLVEDNHTKTLNELKESLAAQTGETGKVVEMKRGGWKQWYRIAAAMFILLGSAAIVYKYVFTEKINDKENIAQVNKKAKADTEAVTNATVPADTDTAAANTTDVATNQPGKDSFTFKVTEQNAKTTIAKTENESAKQTETFAPAAVTVTKNDNEIKDVAKADDASAKESKKLAEQYKAVPESDKAKVQANTLAKPATQNADTYNYAITKRADHDVDKNASGFMNTYKQNIFRGRVVNSSNEPLPFTKISIVNDSFKIGTYADAKGYFNFIAPDSVLNVEAKSVGFSRQQSELRSGLLADNKVVMKESNESLSEVVITSERTNRRKSFREAVKDSIKYLEPEDGWGNYSIYMANNLELPDKIKVKEAHGQVELSFTVDKNGKPQNISVEKSFDKQAEQEAIRLLKEGPRWKTKKKKTKGKLVVIF